MDWLIPILRYANSALATFIAITAIYWLWKSIRFTKHELVVATRTLVRFLVFAVIALLAYATHTLLHSINASDLLLPSSSLVASVVGAVTVVFFVKLVRE